MPLQNKGIWEFARRLHFIAPQFRLTLKEGHTPLKKINNIYFKCENLNPTGSVKDRGICYQTAILSQTGLKKAVIPSSGNAAISAAAYCRKAGIELTVFVSPKIAAAKLTKIKKNSPQVILDKRPLSRSIQFAKENGLINMRPSTDKFGAVGYQTISFELAEELSNIDAVFIPVSSGTILRGVYAGFKTLGKIPAIHAVQTAKINSIAAEFDRNYTPEKDSLASAIVARYVPEREKIIDIIKKTNGSGWVISDHEIKKADSFLKEHRLLCSYEGALSLAGLTKAENGGFRYQNPVCLLTGSL